MKKTLIIAEAGVNHNGDIELAKELIDVAADAGVDYVKFQTFKAEKLVNKQAKKADYQLKNTQKEESQYEMLKRLELDAETHYELIGHCNQKGVKFLSTGFDVGSLEFLNDLGIDLFKIPSGEITNFPYLVKVASFEKPIIVSTGMCTLNEIDETIKLLINSGARKEDLTVLHCNTEYPTPVVDVNLNAMNTIGTEFNVNIGYSDHTMGIEVPIAAVAMGASVIEKHFTLNKQMDGPDHKASLEPDELSEMVKAIRNIEIALGSNKKEPSKSEKKNINIARKSIFVNRFLESGHILSDQDLETKRPGNGISPMKWNEIIGRELKKDLEKGQMIDWNYLK